MKRDLIIGLLVSLLIHGGIGFGGEFFKPKVKKAVSDDGEEMVISIAPPPEIEPEEIESDTANERTTQAETSSFAPPSLVDAPQAVTFDSFTQTLQPPPPPNVNISKTMNVPKGPPATGAVARNMSDVFNVKDLDQQPQAKFKSNPVYPYDLKRQGVEGSAVVEAILSPEGSIIDAWAVKSTHREFEQPAVQAVMKWKFRPGKKGGKNVKVRIQQLIVFKLNAGD
ncbi:energy transducer TonB [Nibricoccus sp. IMCC34717]|uniref:energy transducer TonB n=1 Tax=Nibricoccus sp. IMCC34717 TaxID=3034021 RepID=UPI00384FEF05